MTTIRDDAKESDPQPKEYISEALVLACILLPAFAIILYYKLVLGWSNADWLRLVAAITLSLFFPLLAFSFYYFRKERRKVELQRIVNKLGITGETNYMEMFTDIRTGPYFCLASGMAWLVTLFGFMLLFLGHKLEVDGLASFQLGDQSFPTPGSRLMFGMAFLGTYFWGVQYAFRRYVLNDLIPGVFYSLSIRMLLASTLALLAFNAFGASDSAEIDIALWPAVAFLIGTFPQRGLQYLTERIPGFSSKSNPAVRDLPVDLIEGVSPYDKMRLQELGIESCHDLAMADFIPLVLKSSYGAREVMDWLLQAKLCVYVGQAIGDLRQYGIRGILELADLSDDNIKELALNTAASEISLMRARDVVARDPELGRLKAVAGKLGEYTWSSQSGGGQDTSPDGGARPNT